MLTAVIVFGYYKHTETVGSIWEKTAAAWQEILKVINQCQAVFFSIFCHRRHFFKPLTDYTVRPEGCICKVSRMLRIPVLRLWKDRKIFLARIFPSNQQKHLQSYLCNPNELSNHPNKMGFVTKEKSIVSDAMGTEVIRL